MGTTWREMVALHPWGARQSHASSLLVVGDIVLVAWFAGTHEGASDTRIMLARGGLDGRFGEPVVVADAPIPHWNPVLAWGPDNRVWLFFRRGERIDTWVTWVCRSDDLGVSWGDAVELVPGDTTGGRGPVRQAPLRYGDRWVAPGSVETWDEAPGGEVADATWDCFVDIRDAAGSWQRAPLPLDHGGIRGAGCIQPALVVGSRGQLIALTRSTTGAAHRSETADPRAWPPLAPCGLTNNNSGLAVVAFPDAGTLAAIHNPASDDWGARCPLVVSVSGDDGLTWSAVATVDDGSPWVPGENPSTRSLADGHPSGASASGVVTTGEGEFSYPSAAVVGTELWVTYTWQRRGIALVRLPLATLAGDSAQ